MEQIVHGSIVDENNLSRLHKCCFDKLWGTERNVY